ncbi:hypothetical protein [Streptomyces griseofuscus]|nr:hypothetical protein [Streptomyces griseofuscus]
MKRLVYRFWTDFTDGLRAGRDVLLWGQAYPKRISQLDVWRP